MIITGTTSDGKRGVVRGVFRFFETHGLPLDVLFDMLNRRDLIPDWGSFYSEALAAGMKHARILAKLDEAISDSYGREMRDAVIIRLHAR